MLGDFINRCLILILGYAYPGFECYKTVEKNRVDIEELRFWCKYWIIVALFTVLEKFTDIFIGWLPMYGEMKIVLFVYLWYPKTRGSGYVYETVLRPYVSRHENDIDRKILEWKARSWDIIIFYWQYCAKFGHSAFIQALQHLASQSTRLSSNPTPPKNEVQDQSGAQVASTQTQTQTQTSLMKQSSSLSKSKKWPPSPPSSPSIATIHRKISETQKSQTEEEEAWEPEPVTIDGEAVSVRERINSARARLRRIDTQNPRSPRSPRTPQHVQQ
ncbi:putative HVA22-like protein g [Abrus precatorius]|uniref:HVA22-like protein n=1 Tax=Abrus precatorius TaxID=3816 RepID=A0A8B8M5K7_ABRPR|nr:putative HVA22-like protein g [Abrus precatorius]